MSTNLGTLGHRAKEPRPKIVLVPPPNHKLGDCECARPRPSGRFYHGYEACQCGRLPKRRGRRCIRR